MKKLIGLLTFILIILFIPVSVSAIEPGNNSEKLMTVPQGTVINKDYLAWGDRVEISGVVNGDVYAFAGQIFVDGIVNGDLIAIGGSVNVSGKILQNLRAAGGQITVSGDIGRNSSIAGGNIEMTREGKIRGNAVMAGGNVTIQSEISGDAKVGAGNITIANRIGGNLEASVDTLRIKSGGQIGGDLSYWSSGEASIDDDAIIAGKISKYSPQVWLKPPKVPAAKVFTEFFNQSKIISLIFTFIIGAIFIRFFPKTSSRAVEIISSRSLGSLGRGLLLFLLIPLIILMLIITIIGIPLAFILLIIYLLVLYLARILAIFWLGVFISGKLGKIKQDILAFIIGLLTYAILRYIPVVSGLTAFLASVIGLGAWYLTVRSREIEVHKEPVRKVSGRKRA